MSASVPATKWERGRASGSLACLTDGMANDDRPLLSRGPDQRRFVVFSLVAMLAVWLLVLLAYSHGALRTLGLVLGVPVVAVLLLVGLRLRARNPD